MFMSMSMSRSIMVMFMSEKCLCEYFMLFFRSFSYTGKVITKGIYNIIGIGIVSPLLRESTVVTQDATVF